VTGPAVSVIVPTYQRRELVKRAVASVLSQTVSELELIVVDDGSTDGTEDVLRGVDPRLRYHRQENHGVAAARNAGIELARAPVVAFLDSDNCWLPHHLEVLLETLGRHPDAVMVSTCPKFVIRGRQGAADARVRDALEELLIVNFLGYVSCVGVRREALVRVGGFDDRMRMNEDTDLWVRLAMVGPVATLSRRTIVHQKTAGSLLERARRNGADLDAHELSARSALEWLPRLRPEAGERERAAAEGRRHWVDAMRALVCEDGEALARALREACRVQPSLSTRPVLTGMRLDVHPPRTKDVNARLRYYLAVADAWPDPRAPTARYLRLVAAIVALGLGRPRTAAGALRGVGLRAAPGLARPLAPVFAIKLHRALHARIHRGQETQGAANS
jgi:glycosyl transferase family 2